MKTISFKQFALGAAMAVAMNIAAWANPPAQASAPDDFGVLVMAHGGKPAWNQGVLDAVKPLRRDHTIEVAFGMADPATIQQAVRKLEARGVRRIGIVRLFVSGESWYERTEQILGLRAGALPRPVEDAGGEDHDHGDGHHHSMALWRIDTDAAFALSTQGLAEAPTMGRILADRARTLSREPEREDVLILAHGPADDQENEQWIAQIDARAKAVRQVLPFRRVHVQTLREDWPAKRANAERRIRAFVQRASDEEGQAIVIPFRVQGFGPYARVLEGLEYASDGVGLVPHPNVTQWIAEQIAMLKTRPFQSVQTATIQHPAAPQADRDAILAMAGCYEIEFNFSETVALKPGYTLTKPYIEDAVEWVQVVVDEPDHIVLQHLLIDESSSTVIKHWRQEWCWQERNLLEFRDRNTWVKHTLNEDEARGTWTQKVYQTDDSPRYQGYGKWVHTANMSAWESHPTRRPLPRREYTKRDDYQTILAINRHIITPAGWVHEQDNTKLVVDESGSPVEAIARETGLNRYVRTDDAKGEIARKWWAQRGRTWGEVCEVWDEIYDAAPVLKLQPKVDDKPLSRTLAKQVYQLSEKDLAPDQVRQQVRATIDAYIVRGS